MKADNEIAIRDGYCIEDKKARLRYLRNAARAQAIREAMEDHFEAECERVIQKVVDQRVDIWLGRAAAP